MKPKEDPAAKADRLRQRRLAELDSQNSAQQTAKDLTTDLNGVYGLRAMSLFSAANIKRLGAPAAGRPALPLRPTSER